MNINDYYSQVLVPGNVAVSALRRAGLPIDVARCRQIRVEWTKELADLEKYVEGEAAKRGTRLVYSDKHSIDPGALSKFLYSPATSGGCGLEVKGLTDSGAPATDDEALSWYASLSVPRPDDDPLVRAILQVRSTGGALTKYVDKFEELRRADGCVHPDYNWALRTARLSASNPPVHGIPERSDRRIAEAVKSTIVPRVSPAPNPDEWNPRVHGSCFRWDISGAEAIIRAAMLTHRYCSAPDPIAYEYLRAGKDIHSKTASLLYGVPEGTYKKGSYERDQVGKTSFFLKLFGGTWRALQGNIWKNARVWVPDDEAQRMNSTFEAGYTGLTELYELDKRTLGELGYSQDAYGRRRHIPVPPGATFQNGVWRYNDRDRVTRRAINKAFHVFANTPTQSTNAIDNIFMISLLYHGEYVELRVPPMWEHLGVPFPEAAGWQMHGGAGPGGKPLLAWHMNTVHDSGWGDTAPGCHLEATAKIIWRRCHSVPLDWRLESDVPYRIDLQVGPNMSRLTDYNVAAKRFGLEPMPKR
jgi:hypothetical protein